MNKKKFTKILMASFAVLVILLFVYQLIKKSFSGPLYGPYMVNYVFDGDTIEVIIDGKEERIRLIGIDCPESASHNEEENSEEGRIAAEYTKNLLTNQYVYLEYDIETYDKYGRTLAYVYLDDKETMVNGLIMQNGYAVLMTIQPNSKYSNYFYKLQKEAQKNKVGLWAE